LIGPVKSRPANVWFVLKLKLPMRNGSISVTPCGPLVMLTGCDRLFRKMRTI